MQIFLKIDFHGKIFGIKNLTLENFAPMSLFFMRSNIYRLSTDYISITDMSLFGV